MKGDESVAEEGCVPSVGDNWSVSGEKPAYLGSELRFIREIITV